ncbi:MAG: hypothetical protein PSV35_10165 [bacterium]|nr:hypothetical protein [bacterium]
MRFFKHVNTLDQSSASLEKTNDLELDQDCMMNIENESGEEYFNRSNNSKKRLLNQNNYSGFNDQTTNTKKVRTYKI